MPSIWLAWPNSPIQSINLIVALGLETALGPLWEFGYIFYSYWRLLNKCHIPDDCIDSKRYPLFMARAVLKELIESLQSTQGVKPC